MREHTDGHLRTDTHIPHARSLFGLKPPLASLALRLKLSPGRGGRLRYLTNACEDVSRILTLPWTFEIPDMD
jgi:hypothetical protein